jgi:hypothetical protein
MKLLLLAVGLEWLMFRAAVLEGILIRLCCGRGPDLNGTVISLNGLMDRARGIIEMSIGGSRVAPAHVESPSTKRKQAHTANITTLTGLLNVRGMLVAQGMSTTAVDTQIKDLIAKQANI